MSMTFSLAHGVERWPNKMAARERRDCVAVSLGHHWRVVEQFNRKDLEDTGSCYIPRFKGKYLYLDGDDSGEVGHICRLEYAGPKRGWYFAIYKYSDDRFDEDDWFFPGNELVDRS